MNQTKYKYMNLIFIIIIITIILSLLIINSERVFNSKTECEKENKHYIDSNFKTIDDYSCKELYEKIFLELKYDKSEDIWSYWPVISSDDLSTLDLKRIYIKRGCLDEP